MLRFVVELIKVVRYGGELWVRRRVVSREDSAGTEESLWGVYYFVFFFSSSFGCKLVEFLNNLEGLI